MHVIDLEKNARTSNVGVASWMQDIVLWLKLGKSHSVNDVTSGNVSLRFVPSGWAGLGSVTVSWVSSFQTVSRFGSFHKTNFLRGKVDVPCAHSTSNMVLTESQFLTSNVSNLGNKGSKVKGSTASDEILHSLTINVSKYMKEKSGICSATSHISCRSALSLNSRLSSHWIFGNQQM